ncbi:cation-translocating P-type ATPase [Dysosmobacter sp.]|uniref:cation-translocating P-type ATPase n=1 Tax=Dysosmobacter sp. TaxID=2591382 RepID=UPI002611594E|nr:cation-translocating P-type ATPase [Dysosmobacter sp.]
MKWTHREQPQETAVPGRREMPLLHPTADKGLTSAQAKALAEAGWDNRPVASPTKSDKQIVRENLLTYFNLIFVVLAVCLLLVGDWKDMTFLFIVAANAVIGIVQQLRSKRTIEKLTLLSAAKVRTVRDGVVVELVSDALVREDVIELTAGCQLPADATVLTGQVQVNESLITGEADAIAKAAGDSLLSGSFVINGKCRARLDQVGADSYAAKLTLAAKKDAGPGKSEMMRSLDRLIRFIGVVLIPIGGALFYNQHAVQELGLRQAVVSTVAALIGMIPEGLFLLTSVALAVSVVRLARNRTLIHEMNAIETLARVDVLCVDKTGTVTSPQMEVREVVPLDVEAYPETEISDILGAFCRCLEPDNDTAKAIAERYSYGPAWPHRETVPFSSATKWSAVNFPGRGAYVLGAPEYVLGSEFAPLEKRTAYYAEKGCRVLLLAQCDGAEPGRLIGLVVPIALVVLENPIRPAAPKVFDYFHSQGVAVKVISGDNPVTVSAVAAQAGIDGAGSWVDARELQTDQDIARAVGEYTVFGRVVPNQKRKIVRALQSQGHTVAMTGDGVNDVLALKDADCGVAMASGADAACQVAQLVLLDSDFAAMPKVVAEGRRVINNIQRASALYLVKNILSFFLAIITLFADFPYPFVPIQLTLISALTIGVPSFFLALEPNHDLVRGKFLHNVLRRAFPGGLTAIAVILFAELFVYTFGLTLEELSTICVVLMAVNGLTVIYYAARPLDAKRIALLVTMSVALLAAILFFGEVFALSGLSFAAWLVLIVLVLLVVPVQMTLERIFDKCSAFFTARAEKKARRKGARRAFRKQRRR